MLEKVIKMSNSNDGAKPGGENVTSSMAASLSGIPRGPPTLATSLAVDTFLDTSAALLSVDRDAAIGHIRVYQAVCTRLHEANINPEQPLGTGSAFEGVPLRACGDLDAMFVNPAWPTVERSPSKDKSNYLVAEEVPGQPVFLKLRTIKDMTYCEEVTSSIESTTDEDEVYKGHLSSEKFVLSYRGSHPDDEGYKEGPSIVRQINKYKPEETMDTVPSLKSSFWPRASEDFFTRRRTCGWPPAALTERIKDDGCHVVGKGSSSSECKDLEWRWSFSRAEQELLLAMSGAMRDCMHLLKAIKSDKWVKGDPEKPSSFCSYFIKTACLWVSESEDALPEKSVVYCCRKVLSWLYTSYKTRKMPHYFIPQQNLTGHMSEEMLKEASDWLLWIRAGLWNVVLDVVRKDPTVEELIIRACEDLAIENSINPIPYLCVNEKTAECLQKATQQIDAKSDVYEVYKHIDWAKWSDNFWSSLYKDPLNYIERNREAIVEQQRALPEPKRASVIETIMCVPEVIVLSIISDLKRFVPPGYEHMFTQTLKRAIGDTYHVFLFYISSEQVQEALQLTPEMREPLTDAMTLKVAEYYEFGLEMIYPSGWRDKGLGGYVLLAKFFYLGSMWQSLGGILKKLAPLLDEAKMHDVTFNSLSNIVLCLETKASPWKVDAEVTQWLSGLEDVSCNISPVSMGYYIVGRFSLREGDIQAARKARDDLEYCVDLSEDLQYCSSTKALADILTALLIKLENRAADD